MERTSIDWQTPDWSREKPNKFWDPGRKLLKSLRDYQKIGASSNPVSLLKKKICVLRHRFWSVVSGADIPLSCNIGGGLLLLHPNGIVIHPDTVIGVNCLILQQVTLTRGVCLEYHVDIGAGAKLLGPLKIGHSARVGANAVVTKDVTSGDTVAGVPATVISKGNV